LESAEYSNGFSQQRLFLFGSNSFILLDDCMKLKQLG